MAGPVNPVDPMNPMSAGCARTAEELTELLMLGQELPSGLADHVAACPRCAAEAQEVRQVLRTFERAGFRASLLPEPAAGGEPAHAAVPQLRGPDDPVPAGNTGTAPARRRPRGRAALAAGALLLAACAAALGLVATAGHRAAPDAAGISVAQEGRMVPHSWGTEVPVLLSGLAPGRTYRLETGDAHGHRQTAGSVHAGGSGRPMHVRMVTAMPRSAITTLYVQDTRGRMVAEIRVTPRPVPGATGV